MIYTGPIDYYFDYKFGKLKYRSIKFIFETYDCESYQPVASTRWPMDYDYTRITEFKKLTGQKSDKRLSSRRFLVMAMNRSTLFQLMSGKISSKVP